MEFLKTVLGDELYAQVEAKLKESNVKLADLSSGAYVSKSKYDEVDIQKLQGEIKDWESEYHKDLAAMAQFDAKV